MELKSSFKSEDGETKRLVFTLEDDYFLVVKLWKTDKPRTFKVWQGDYAKVISFWKTNVKFDPSEEEVEDAITFVFQAMMIIDHHL